MAGTNLALVGGAHRRRPQPVEIDDMANTPTPMANTYRYRDPEKRRAYMRTRSQRTLGVGAIYGHVVVSR